MHRLPPKTMTRRLKIRLQATGRFIKANRVSYLQDGKAYSLWAKGQTKEEYGKENTQQEV